MDNGISLGDAMALRGQGNDGYNDGFAGGWFWIVILFLFMFGNGNWGGNNANQGALTRAEMWDGFNFNQLENGQRSIERGICDLGYNQLNNAKDIQMQIAANGYQQKECCCETNRNIDAVRAENYKNTCEITTAIHAEGEATRALINANVMQELRDKLAERDRELMSANFQISQIAQTTNIVNTLRPFPIPSYNTCSPYESNPNFYGCGGCNRNACCN